MSVPGFNAEMSVTNMLAQYQRLAPAGWELPTDTAPIR
jgi:hypothetical protein